MIDKDNSRHGKQTIFNPQKRPLIRSEDIDYLLTTRNLNRQQIIDNLFYTINLAQIRGYRFNEKQQHKIISLYIKLEIFDEYFFEIFKPTLEIDEGVKQEIVEKIRNNSNKYLTLEEINDYIGIIDKKNDNNFLTEAFNEYFKLFCKNNKAIDKSVYNITNEKYLSSIQIKEKIIPKLPIISEKIQQESKSKLIRRIQSKTQLRKSNNRYSEEEVEKEVYDLTELNIHNDIINACFLYDEDDYDKTLDFNIKRKDNELIIDIVASYPENNANIFPEEIQLFMIKKIFEKTEQGKQILQDIKDNKISSLSIQRKAIENNFTNANNINSVENPDDIDLKFKRQFTPNENNTNNFLNQLADKYNLNITRKTLPKIKFTQKTTAIMLTTKSTFEISYSRDNSKPNSTNLILSHQEIEKLSQPKTRIL